MFKQLQKAEGRMQINPDAEYGLRNGENLGSGIFDKRLGCRALRQLRRNREILESESEVTARLEPRPTGRAKLRLSPFRSDGVVFGGQHSSSKQVGDGPAAGIFNWQIKFLTVRDLIMAWAVIACDFHDASFEWRTGGIDRAAIKAKQRLNMRQRRASPAIRFWVAQSTGRCRRVPVPRRSAGIPVCGCWGLSSPQFATAENIAELESSANPQAGKACATGRCLTLPVGGSPTGTGESPVLPIFPLITFNLKLLHQIMSNFSR